jgi:hydroxypyruvate isomerase
MLPLSAHLSMLFRELPYIERPKAAREAGFSAIETWWPGELGDAWAAEVQGTGGQVALLNCYGGDIEAGQRGFLNLPERREQTVRDFKAAVELARRVGAPRINVLAGLELPGVPRRTQLAEAVSTLRECASVAAAADVTIVVEQINKLDIPRYLVPSAREVADLIETVGSNSVRMLYDVYHAARSGTDPLTEALPYIELIDHIHYADFPGRGAPGTGRVDFVRLLEALEKAGYSGMVGLEYDPRGPTMPTLGFLQNQRGRLGAGARDA